MFSEICLSKFSYQSWSLVSYFSPLLHISRIRKESTIFLTGSLKVEPSKSDYEGCSLAEKNRGKKENEESKIFVELTSY